MTNVDTDYFTRRETDARRMAERAHDPHIAALHLEMARAYAARTGVIYQRPLHLVSH